MWMVFLAMNLDEISREQVETETKRGPITEPGDSPVLRSPEGQSTIITGQHEMWVCLWKSVAVYVKKEVKVMGG